MIYTYDYVPTPFGDALAVFSEAGIVRFDLSEAEDPTVPWLLESIAHSLGSMPEPDVGAADDLAHRVAAYFDGAVIDFRDHVTFDWQLAQGLSGDVLRAIGDIGYGETTSYGDLAAQVGRPGAARAVGSVCRRSPFSVLVPVHRVIRSDGSLGQFGTHPQRKQYLLDLERAVLN